MEWNHKKMCIHNPNLYNCAACVGQSMLGRVQDLQQAYQAGATGVGQSMLGRVQGLQQAYQSGATGSPSSYDLDYQMFLKYAELSDGELMNCFYDEELFYKENLERQIEFLKAQTERDIAAHRISFLNWVAKYRKQITEKRLDELKAFL